MNFTIDDIHKIKLALDSYAIKDSELQEADFPILYNDTISIVLNGTNKKIDLGDFIQQLSLLYKDPILNITDKFNKSHIPLSEAIQSVPYSNRMGGLIITFKNELDEWVIYQFIGSINQFNNNNLWKKIN